MNIQKKKPSELPPLGDILKGDEIFQVTIPNIGTYKISANELREQLSINAMTEEELENLEHPIEGAFYATYE